MFQSLPTEAMAAIVASSLAFLSSIAVAVIQVVGNINSNKYRRRREENEAKIELQRQQRHAMDEAVYHSMSAVLEAQDIALIALQGGHLNGNVEAARTKINDARSAYANTRDKIVTGSINS